MSGLDNAVLPEIELAHRLEMLWSGQASPGEIDPVPHGGKDACRHAHFHHG